jgi:multiple sugar transport system permease protein
MSGGTALAPAEQANDGLLPAWRRSARPYLLVIPAVALTIGILYPFVQGAIYAFQNYKATRPNPEFIGFRNFERILTDDKFWHSVGVTAKFAIGATLVETVLGVAVALLLARSSLVSRVFERFLILPLMVAPIIATIMWRLMMQPSVGILNYVLSPIGLGNQAWTDTPTMAMFSVILIDVWIFTPFVALLVLAGLRSLPRAPFEAASVEGASFWFTFRNLTLPMLWPYILVAVIFRLMDSLKVFDVIFALTGGGPGDATMALQIQAYQDAIPFSNFSIGQTYMLILWFVVYIATFGLIKVLAKAQARAAGV